MRKIPCEARVNREFLAWVTEESYYGFEGIVMEMEVPFVDLRFQYSDIRQCGEHGKAGVLLVLPHKKSGRIWGCGDGVGREADGRRKEIFPAYPVMR